MKTLTLKIFILACISITAGCSKRGKDNLKNTITLNDYNSSHCNTPLYLEVYKAGLLGSLTSLYITDSVNFAKYLGKFDDENEMITCQCHGDTINVYLKTRNKDYVLVMKETKKYSIANLTKQGDFD